MSKIVYNRPSIVGNEIKYILSAIEKGHISGNGEFTKLTQTFLKNQIGCSKVLLTHSCTAALEMAAILAEIKPGDEIIMPSFTFVSTANAFVLRGGVPVFVDIREDTLNLDEEKIEAAISSRTKVIVPVHYAGVGCEMDRISEIANKHDLLVISDAAQGINSTYKGRPLGSISPMSALSFHETKNVFSGEGGALLINDPELIQRAEVIWEKGTNRKQFFQGIVDKYTWVDIGSSFLPSDIIAAFLLAQLEEMEKTINLRKNIWNQYHKAFEELEKKGQLRRPIIPDNCSHNAHIYHLLLPNKPIRDRLLALLNNEGVGAVFHYIPLHSSPAGKKYGRAIGDLSITNNTSDTLLRLPLWPAMTDTEVAQVINSVKNNIMRLESS